MEYLISHDLTSLIQPELQHVSLKLLSHLVKQQEQEKFNRKRNMKRQRNIHSFLIQNHLNINKIFSFLMIFLVSDVA